ncbi:MAG: polysaccharide biosynthesis tyrosine autokinase [Pseudomonadota bacterium]|nr:polysaccharide biosynthesis tyrosine autokinase [Pseudomonadota bacterium]
MIDRGRASRALAHSGIDDGDYIFINPRKIIRVLLANKRFILICIVAAMGVSQAYNFFFSTPLFLSEVRLRIEIKNDPIGLTPLIDRFQGHDKSYQQANALIEETKSTQFLNTLLKEYIKKRYPLTPFIPKTRHNEILNWLYGSLKADRSFEKIYKRPEWTELAGYLGAPIIATANFDANMIILQVKTNSPSASANLANVAAYVLEKQNLEKLKENVRRLKDFVANQTSERKLTLEKLEASRVILQKQTEATSTISFKKEEYLRYTDDQTKLQALKRQIKTGDNVILQTQEELKKIKENLTNPKMSNSDLYLSQLQHRMELLQYQRALVSDQSSPDFDQQKIEIQTELDEISGNYQKFLEERDKMGGISFIQPMEYLKSLEQSLVKLKGDQKRFKNEEINLANSIQIQKREIAKLPDVLRKFEDLQRQIQIGSDLYLGLQQKLQEVEIMEAGITNDLQKISTALPSTTPIGLSAKIRFIVAALAGLLFALALLVLKNTFIHTVRSFKELQNEGITVIGEVPIVPGLAAPVTSFLGKSLDRVINRNIDNMFSRFGKVAPSVFRRIDRIAPKAVSQQLNKLMPHIGKLQKTLGMNHLKKPSELIVMDKPNSQGADIFRYMRLRLSSFMSTTFPDNKNGKVVLVTSPTEANGKTFISTNLAASLGKGEVKTLLIDLDLRNSSVNTVLKEFNRAKGIETAVKTKTKFEDYIISVTKYFDVLVCNPGIENPTEVLESQSLRDFIEAQKANYEYIFIDSPPVLAACDPALIAPQVDVILMVTAYEITFREDVQLAIEGLQAGKKHPMVGVLNLVDSGFNYGYGYGYGYHNKKAS